MCLPLSMRAWAALACLSGKVESIGGLTRPEAMSGRTFFSTARAGGLIRDRARTQRRTGMGETLEHQPHKIDGHPRRGQKRDLHDPSLDAGRFIVAADIIAAHHV